MVYTSFGCQTQEFTRGDWCNAEAGHLYPSINNKSYHVKWKKRSNVPYESKYWMIQKPILMIIFSSTSIPIDSDTRIIPVECV